MGGEVLELAFERFRKEGYAKAIAKANAKAYDKAYAEAFAESYAEGRMDEREKELETISRNLMKRNPELTFEEAKKEAEDLLSCP